MSATLIELDGEQLRLFEWAKRYNISPYLVSGRILSGWDVREALTTPVAKRPTKPIAGPPAKARPRGLPVVRSDCLPGGRNEQRPCAYSSCRYHLALEWSAGDDGKPRPLESMPYTCALDAADRGGMTLDEVGEALGVTREGIRFIESGALHKMTANRLKQFTK